MNKISKDNKFGIQGQLKTSSNPTFTGTPHHNMMDHAKSVGAYGIGMYSTGNKGTMASGSKSSKVTMQNPDKRSAPGSMGAKGSSKKLSIQRGNKTI